MTKIKFDIFSFQQICRNVRNTCIGLELDLYCLVTLFLVTGKKNDFNLKLVKLDCHSGAVRNFITYIMFISCLMYILLLSLFLYCSAWQTGILYRHIMFCHIFIMLILRNKIKYDMQKTNVQ